MATYKHKDGMPVQGGFIVLRPSVIDYENIIDILLTTEFRKGKGWNSSKIGWYWGGMTVQGVLPYYYNMVTAPNRSEIVDRCVYNSMADTKDCWKRDVKALKSAHFTVRILFVLRNECDIHNQIEYLSFVLFFCYPCISLSMSCSCCKQNKAEQRKAMQSNAKQCRATQSNAEQRNAKQRNAEQRTEFDATQRTEYAKQSSAEQCSATQSNAEQCRAMQSNAEQCRAMQSNVE
jgi:hypothetical protein